MVGLSMLRERRRSCAGAERAGCGLKPPNSIRFLDSHAAAMEMERAKQLRETAN
jgi:hypothetical protein